MWEPSFLGGTVPSCDRSWAEKTYGGLVFKLGSESPVSQANLACLPSCFQLFFVGCVLLTGEIIAVMGRGSLGNHRV